MLAVSVEERTNGGPGPRSPTFFELLQAEHVLQYGTAAGGLLFIGTLPEGRRYFRLQSASERIVLAKVSRKEPRSQEGP